MTPVDIKNFDIIEKYIKQYGFTPESEAYALAEMRMPHLDEEYAKILGPDLRKRWKITKKDNVDILGERDESWKLFKIFFRHFPKMNINYTAFRENKVLVGKNQVKLKKVMLEYYAENPVDFSSDYNNSLNINTTGWNVSLKGNDTNKKIIEAYIIKAFEKIGTKKAPANEMELVLSCNFADWLLCSTGEDWSSCLSIEGGAYWTGLPTLIGDKNRAFLYITNGRKKIWNGVVVDGITTRTWVLLTDKNAKKLVKMYPQDLINIDDIITITGDTSYTYATTSHNAKHEIHPIVYKKGDVWYTIYNDACILDREKFKTTGKIYWSFGGGRTADIVSVKHKIIGNINVRKSYSRLHHYLENNKFINDDIIVSVCSCCGTVLSGSNMVSSGNDLYCTSCAPKVLTKCDKCGDWHKKEEVKPYTIDNKVYKLCETCSTNKTFICHSCKDRHWIDSNTITLSGNKKVCGVCAKTEVVECIDCAEKMLRKEAIKHDTTFVCPVCYGKKKKYREFDYCVDCNTSHHNSILIYNAKGVASCEKCINKYVYNNEKQMKLPFLFRG